MSGEFRFRRYRDEAAMERDASALAADGWSLRAWRVRGQKEDVDFAGLPPSEVGTLGLASGWQWPMALWEIARLVLYIPVAVLAWGWAMVAGRKPIEAVFERTEGRV